MDCEGLRREEALSPAPLGARGAGGGVETPPPGPAGLRSAADLLVVAVHDVLQGLVGRLLAVDRLAELLLGRVLGEGLALQHPVRLRAVEVAGDRGVEGDRLVVELERRLRRLGLEGVLRAQTALD